MEIGLGAQRQHLGQLFPSPIASGGEQSASSASEDWLSRPPWTCFGTRGEINRAESEVGGVAGVGMLTKMRKKGEGSNQQLFLRLGVLATVPGP